MEVCKLYVLLLIYVCIGLSQTQFVYNANEESGKDDYLGNIAQDMELMPVGVGKPPRQYTILNGAEFVRVDKNTGELFTAVRLDREKLCPDNPETCKKDIEVAVLPSEYFQLVKIQLVIFDLNDNTPAFPSSQISKEISESAISGSVIRLDSAVDPDLGNNSINRYEISSSPPSAKDKNGLSVPYFKLDVLNNIDGTKIPQLILSKKLDRERIASYDLFLYAIDGADPPLTGTATVHIEVTDSNDHQPTFPKQSYVISVPEDVNDGYEVIKLKATDLDSGENARIVYTFPSEVSEQERAIFALNSETGSLTVTGAGLDYENRTIHHLTIEARDSGPNPAAAYVTVTVQVEDVNDEKPRIDVNFLDQEESPVSGEGTESDPVLIRENTAVGTFVAFVTVTDRDTGKNGNVSCRLLEPTSFEMQRVDQKDNRYLLKTKNELDRETQRIHTVEIQAWDFGAPSLSNNKRIVVELVDENDNSPKFGKPNYVLGVSENTLPGDVIATLTAEDLDAGANAEITYSARPMERGVKVPFEIEPETGQVIFKSGATPLDAENKTEPFVLTITATDHGVPPRNTSATLSISVADENDNPPRFRQKNYIFRIEEDADVGKYVGRVVADDADVEKTTNARVTYSFADGSKDSPFTIQPESGEIHFNGRREDLDRESRHSQPYVLKAEATDHGNSPLTGICNVEIFLLDVNDNAPFIKFPNVTKDLSVVYIRKERIRPSDPDPELLGDENPAEKGAESADTDEVAEVKPENPVKDFILIDKKGSGYARRVSKSENIVITKIEAADPDEGESGRVRFAMSKGNDYGYFGVDMVTGNVTLEVTSEEQLRKMKPGCHVIEVKVSDLGKPTQATLTWVGIYVTDEDPVKFNKTKALSGCRNNSYFPDIYKHKGTALSTAGLDPLILYIIIGASALVVVIIIIVLVVMLRRKCRCCQDKKSRTYNVPSAADMYTDTSYTHGSPIVKRGQKGSPSMHHRIPNNGTVDSRSSFYSEWNAQMGQKGEHMHMMQRQRSVESLGSRTSARDSGTGDSMPSDAYHSTQAYKQQFANQPYQRQSYNQPHMQPSHVYLPPQDENIDEENRQMARHPHGNGMVFTSKCTNDCRLYGHGDNCWMPDSLQRPPSRMTSFKTPEDYESDSLRYPKRALSPNSYHHQQQVDGPDYHNMRYTSAPSNTPYYYDPGSKFDPSGQQQRGKFSTFRDDVNSDTGSPAHSQVASSNVSRQPSTTAGYRHPGYSSQGQLAPPAYSQSPVPFNAASPTPYNGQPRGKAYVNLQGGGYDMNGVGPDEAHSNLSSASSGNHPSYPQGYPTQHYPQDQMQPYYPSYQGYGGQPAPTHYGDQQGYGSDQQFEQDFSATNLILSPADSEPGDYKQRLERQMLQHQHPQQPGHGYGHPMDAGDNQRLLEENQAPVHQEDGASLDKLSTIREELDADEVVAEIDGLLL
ncbi:protocadherin-11 X-linked-like [Clavelina lepadiformis]|uniref:protocadherin-11 X-linked-like n=1 Tax=Clavelina lepadiformis TaxID=159417 RepID=UPI00404154D8